MPEGKERPKTSLLVKILFVVICVVIILGVFFTPHRHNPENTRRIMSMSNMRQILIAIYGYESDLQIPLGDLPYLETESYVDPEAQIFANPRENFSGYYFESPGLILDEVEYPMDTPVLFEVRDDGTVMRDSGVIGYADGHVAYVREE